MIQWKAVGARHVSPLHYAVMIVLLLLASGCGATALQVVPTARPTATATPTGAPTRTPARDVTPTVPPTSPPTTPTGGPSPTPLFGPTITVVAQPTDSQSLNPNAPRIEFFTSDASAVAPGNTVTLFWSTRGARDAVIYQLVRGVRNRVWNVGPDGSLPVTTSRSDRGTADFVLHVGEGSQFVEQNLSIPLACPDVWFFQPSPEACPRPAQETQLIEEPFEQGRMLYDAATDQIYALFNDGLAPAWLVVQNRFDPAIHPESDPDFAAALPPGYYQPLRRLGFVWRGNDTVRNRLGLAIQPEANYNGFTQTSVTTEGAQTLYISSADGTVLQLLPQGASWQIITSP